MALDPHKTALLVIDVQNEYQKQGERKAALASSGPFDLCYRSFEHQMPCCFLGTDTRFHVRRECDFPRLGKFVHVQQRAQEKLYR